MRKSYKVLLISMVAFIFLLVGIELCARLYVKPLVEKQLKRAIEKGSDSLYRVRYGKIGISLWTGNVVVNDLQLSVDSVRFRALQAENNLPALSISLLLKKASMEGLALPTLLFKKRIQIRTIETSGADISLHRHYKKEKDSLAANRPPLWKLLKPEFEEVKIGEILLEDIALAYFDHDSSTSFQWQFEDFDTRISDIVVDSSSLSDEKRLLYAGNIETHVRKIKLFTADSLYRLQVKALHYDLKQRWLGIDSLNLSPTLNYVAFYQKCKLEKDIYTVAVPHIYLKGFRPDYFFTDNRVDMDSLLISDMNLSIYHDRNIADDPQSKLGKFPHQLLQKAPFFIRIRGAAGKNIQVTYTEKDDKTQQEGSLYFHDVDGLAKHISNIPSDVDNKPFCSIKLNGYFMSKTYIHGGFVFDLSKTDGRFEAEAHISPMDVTELNALTEALAYARFKSLQTGYAYFKMKGNEYGGYGYLELPYENLALELLHTAKSKIGEKHRLQTLLVNSFSHTSNPSNKAEMRIARQVYEPRNIHRSFFNLVWKTLYRSSKEVAMKNSAKKIQKMRKAFKKNKQQALATK